MPRKAGVLLSPPERHWHCPACDRTAVTRDATNARLHACPRAGGLLTPYLEVPPGQDGVRGKVTVVQREDYEGESVTSGRELLTRDDAGRPAMRVSVEGGRSGEQQKHSIFVPCIVTRLGMA